MDKEQTTDLPQAPEASTETTTIDKKERDWALIAHIASFSGALFPLGHLLAPLVIWQMKKEEMPFAAQEAKESLNFNISMTIYGIIAGLMIFILIGLLILPVLGIAYIILLIKNGIQAGEGKSTRYPYIFRFIS